MNLMIKENVMKHILVLVIIFLLLTILLLNKDYNNGKLSKKSYLFIGILEGLSALVSIALFFAL